MVACVCLENAEAKTRGLLWAQGQLGQHGKPMPAKAMWQDLVSKVKDGKGGRGIGKEGKGERGRKEGMGKEEEIGKGEGEGRGGERKDKNFKLQKMMLRLVWIQSTHTGSGIKGVVISSWAAIGKWLSDVDSYFINRLTHRWVQNFYQVETCRTGIWKK